VRDSKKKSFFFFFSLFSVLVFDDKAHRD